MERRWTLFCFVLQFLLQGEGQLLLPEEITVTTEEELQVAMESIHSHQTIRVDADAVNLSQTLAIKNVSGVIITAANSALIKCPPSGNALSIEWSSVTLERLTIRGCVKDSGLAVKSSEMAIIESNFTSNNSTYGGAIEISGKSNVSVSHSYFLKNNAESGGAIHISNSSDLSIKNSVFSTNGAIKIGGGLSIYDSSSASVENCEFRQNNATRGATINVEASSKLSAINTAFDSNSAVQYGAGLLIYDSSSASIENCEFIRNNAMWGGAAYVQVSSNLSAIKTTFDSNSAIDVGAGIYIYDSSSVSVENCEFRRNSATRGAAVNVEASSKLSVINTAFDSNNAAQYGAGLLIYNSSSASVKNCEFRRNSAAQGGAAYVQVSSNLSAINTTFDSNNAFDVGAGIYIYDSSSVSVENCEFRRNSATQGGAVRVSKSSELSAIKTTFSGNNANKKGGVISVFGLSNSMIKDCQFRQNKAQDGGAVYVEDSSDLSVRGSALEANEATESGGAVHLRESNAIIFDSRFSENNAQSGGACLVNSKSRLHVDRSSFRANTALQSGGGVGVVDGDVYLEDCQFEGNRAVLGSGISSEQGGEVKAIASNFTSNNASLNGGGIHSSGGSTSLIACSLRDNRAQVGGALKVVDSVDLFIRDSFFIANDASEKGGALFASGSTVSISESKFDRNNASEKAGAVHSVSSRLEIGSSIFSSNRGESGGAIFAESGRIGVLNSIFSKNNATVAGGAIAVVGTSTDYPIETTECAFKKNAAGRGGAVSVEGPCAIDVRGCSFEANRAASGGAIVASRDSVLSVLNATKFCCNFAEKGGAVMCEDCGGMGLSGEVEFFRNVASDSGGAVQALRVRKKLEIDSAAFRENVAPIGGAISFAGGRLAVGGDKPGSVAAVEFVGNAAVSGGALHYDPGTSELRLLKMVRAEFSRNRAENCSRIAALSRESVPQPSPTVRSRALEEACESSSAACVEGSGGALFVAWRDSTPKRRMEVAFDGVRIFDNTALLGGGGYIVDDRSEEGLEVESRACADSRGSVLCPSPIFTGSVVEKNAAAVAGGGLFVSSAKSLDYLSVWGSSSGEGSPIVPANLDGRLAVADNHVKVGGYGPDVATDARRLRLSGDASFLGTFQIGRRLALRGGDGANAPDASRHLSLEVKDFLDQTITAGSEDAGLRVALESDRVYGATHYTATGGVIGVNDTYVRGPEGINATLEFRAEDRRNITAAVRFSVEACGPGEFPSERQEVCERCSVGAYKFGATDKCRPCERNAVCDGSTALVPEEGFWHSNPFSPQMRRCLVKNACSGQDRTARLLGFHGNTSAVLKKLAEFGANQSFGGYEQCAGNHSGVLCGSCQDRFALTPNGECKECSLPRRESVAIGVLLAVVLLVVVALKSFLASDGVVKEVEVELRRQHSDVTRLIEREAFGQSIFSKKFIPDSLSVVNRSLSDPLLREKAIPEYSDRNLREDPGPSTRTASGSGARLSRLARAEGVQDPLVHRPREKATSEEARTASNILSAIFNITFNYVQLSSAALYLGVDWKAVKSLLSAQATAGRFAKLDFAALGCAFPDRDRDEGVRNSILTLWSRIAFPLVAIGLYAVFKATLDCFRGEIRKGRYDVDPVPRATLVAVVVFFSFIIDISSDLFKMLDCASLENTVADHPYGKYEAVDSAAVWTEDTAVACWEGDHLVSAVLASIGLAQCLCVLAFVFAALNGGRRRRELKKRDFMLKYGFPYSNYKKEGAAVYWELVITVRKVLIAAVSVYASKRGTPNTEIGMMAFVLFTAIALQSIFQPFEEEDLGEAFPSYAGDLMRRLGAARLVDRWTAFNKSVTLNAMEAMSLYMSLSLFLVAISINDEETNPAEVDLLLAVCFVLNGLYLAFMVYRLYYALHHSLDVAARDRQIIADELEGGRGWNTWMVCKARALAGHRLADRGGTGTEIAGDDVRRPLAERGDPESSAEAGI